LPDFPEELEQEEETPELPDFLDDTDEEPVDPVRVVLLNEFLSAMFDAYDINLDGYWTLEEVNLANKLLNTPNTTNMTQ
jgi:hypothetical protein